jgi:hypothetical protein
VRHARGVRGVLLRVLVGRVGGDLGRDVVADAFGDPVGVGEQRAELLVEGLQDVAQPVQFGLGLVAAASVGTGSISASSSASAIFIAAFFSTR